MARDVWEYFEERRRECERYGLVELGESQYVERAGTSRKMGRINLRLGLTETAWISAMEWVRVEGNSITRISYAYYLLIDGQEYLARDLDSVHGYHGHTIGHDRVAAGRITFKRFVELAWDIVEQEEGLAEGDAG